MKTTLNSRRDHHLAKFTIFLVMAALIAGMAGCVPVRYRLTISSTEGGEVSMPGEGRDFPYIEGRNVFLVAEAETDYLFVNWTGDVDTIVDVNAHETSIIMHGNYSITANFALNITKITDWFGLDRVRDNPDGTYVLMNGLNSTTDGWEDVASPTADDGMGWEPIGGYFDPFTGSFNGSGYEIRDLSISRATEDYVGFFGHVEGEEAVILNVTLVNATVTGDRYVGGLVGRNEGGNVSKSYSTGTVTGAFSVGGLVGWNKGIVEMSYSQGSVNGSAKYVGGLVGWNGDTVGSSNSASSVTGSNKYVGGLVGWNEGNVSRSNSTGNVTGDNKYVGGLVGWNEGNVEMSDSQGSVNGSADHVGGLVGWNQGTVRDSRSQGSVNGSADHVGGLVGHNEGGDVSNSYSTGNVTGKNYVGGLVGRNCEESDVSDSYSTGNVTGGDGVGGLVGFSDKSTVSNSHYNYHEVLINGRNTITTGALFGEDFEQWLTNDKSLDVNERLLQEDGYYVVNNVTDFKELLAFGQNRFLEFRLRDDLDLASEANFYIPYFAGEFDGNGHKISNLSLNLDFVYNVGLFGCLVPGGRVSEVGVEDVDITGGSYVGGLVGSSWEGKVSDSYSTAIITGNNYTGGLVGSNDAGDVNSCNSRGRVTGDWHVGGLVGCNYEEGTVSNSSCTGSVGGNRLVGGLAGRNRGTMSNSFATGHVTDGDVVGGLVGWNEAIVSKSFSIGSVAVTDGDVVGGLVGWNDYEVSNSHCTGNVSGHNWVGGLVGINGAEGRVNRCYCAGKVTAKENENVGGMVARTDEGGEVSRSFWDTETSGQASSAGGTGKNTTQMQNSATFTEWQIIAVIDPDTRNTEYDWNIVNGETYPFLSWKPVESGVLLRRRSWR